MKALFYFPLVLFAAILFCANIEAQSKSAIQTKFGVETEVRKPYAVPAKIATAFGVDRNLLTGSLVDLDGDRNLELIVQSSGGANVTEFRIYRKVGRNWRQVLITVAHSLWVEKKPDSGRLRIRIAAASATTG